MRVSDEAIIFLLERRSVQCKAAAAVAAAAGCYINTKILNKQALNYLK